MADKPIAVESKPQFPMCNVRLTFLPLATMAGLFLAGCEGAPRTADTAGLEGGTASAEAPAGAQAYRASSSDFGSHLSDGSSPATVPPVQDPDPTSQVTASRTTAIVRAARTVAPAVVTIAVRRRERVRRRSFFDPYYLPFRETQGLGSGFIIDPHGTVLTNHHVVDDATEILVTLPDARDFNARLAGSDPATDIAVLVLQDAEDLQVVTVTAAIQADRGLASSEGALVVEISDNLSRITGLATGDVLLGVNNRRVDTAREAAEELRRTQQGDRSFFLAFERDGRLVRTGLLTWR